MRHPSDWSYFEWVGAIGGFLGVSLYNHMYNPKQRPALALPLNILAAVGFYYVGLGIEYASVKRNNYKRNLVYDYVRLHPEDFVEEKKQYKDILQPWYPSRR